jgi:hypothetical protein
MKSVWEKSFLESSFIQAREHKLKYIEWLDCEEIMENVLIKMDSRDIIINEIFSPSILLVNVK